MRGSNSRSSMASTNWPRRRFARPGQQQPCAERGRTTSGSYGPGLGPALRAVPDRPGRTAAGRCLAPAIQPRRRSTISTAPSRSIIRPALRTEQTRSAPSTLDLPRFGRNDSLSARPSSAPRTGQLAPLGPPDRRSINPTSGTGTRVRAWPLTNVTNSVINAP